MVVDHRRRPIVYTPSQIKSKSVVGTYYPTWVISRETGPEGRTVNLVLLSWKDTLNTTWTEGGTEVGNKLRPGVGVGTRRITGTLDQRSDWHVDRPYSLIILVLFLSLDGWRVWPCTKGFGPVERHLHSIVLQTYRGGIVTTDPINKKYQGPLGL